MTRQAASPHAGRAAPPPHGTAPAGENLTRSEWASRGPLASSPWEEAKPTTHRELGLQLPDTRHSTHKLLCGPPFLPPPSLRPTS